MICSVGHRAPGTGHGSQPARWLARKGSHHLGPLEHIEEGSWHLPPDEWPVTRAEPVEAEAGDVLIFSYLTIHGSGVNTSNEARTTWLVQFRDPADLPIGDKHTFSRG